MRSAVLVALLLAVLVALPADARGRRCDAHRALVKSTRVLVFRASRADEASRLYACRRPAGRALALADEQADDYEYGSDAYVRMLRIKGRWVAFAYATGEASFSQCGKYQQSNCPLPRYRLRLVDVFGRSRFATSISQLPGRVVLSSAGAVAWVEGSQLRALRAGDPARTLDTGTIDPQSLRVEGLVVSWTRDGTPMSADLAA